MRISYKAGKEIEWIELNVILFNAPLSKSEILDLASSLDEQDVDSILNEMEWRTSAYHRPIYKVENNTVVPNCSWRDIPEYFLCLYYSYYGANDRSGGTKLFEQISANVLKNFIGGEVYTLGFPSGIGLNDSLDRISQLCSEQRNLRANGTYNDDGVDVVGYKLFGDQRSSNLYVLLQCAAGKHWTAKNSISINRWTNYLVWYTNNIITSISTVEFVKSQEWQKHSSTYGMLLDRLRIQNYLYQHGVDMALRDSVISWCNGKIAVGI